jgi:hypothetical protein
MISPEEFYERRLKGKTLVQINGEIRKLKHEILRLSRIVNRPDYRSTMDPAEDVQLICCQEYLSRAIQARNEISAFF